MSAALSPSQEENQILSRVSGFCIILIPLVPPGTRQRWYFYLTSLVGITQTQCLSDVWTRTGRNVLVSLPSFGIMQCPWQPARSSEELLFVLVVLSDCPAIPVSPSDQTGHFTEVKEPLRHRKWFSPFPLKWIFIAEGYNSTELRGC